MVVAIGTAATVVSGARREGVTVGAVGGEGRDGEGVGVVVAMVATVPIATVGGAGRVGMEDGEGVAMGAVGGEGRDGKGVGVVVAIATVGGAGREGIEDDEGMMVGTVGGAGRDGEGVTVGVAIVGVASDFEGSAASSLEVLNFDLRPFLTQGDVESALGTVWDVCDDAGGSTSIFVSLAPSSLTFAGTVFIFSGVSVLAGKPVTVAGSTRETEDGVTAESLPLVMETGSACSLFFIAVTNAKTFVAASWELAGGFLAVPLSSPPAVLLFNAPFVSGPTVATATGGGDGCFALAGFLTGDGSRLVGNFPFETGDVAGPISSTFGLLASGGGSLWTRIGAAVGVAPARMV